MLAKSVEVLDTSENIQSPSIVTAKAASIIR